MLRKIVVRRAKLGELGEQLVKQLDQVRTEQEELAVAERVIARMAEQFAAAAADATPAEVQVAGRVVLLVPHRGPGMAQDALRRTTSGSWPSCGTRAGRCRPGRSARSWGWR
ncbi:hypothetical protein [Streptomyces lunaelactis]|uniref:hypothetical protein n=1 Tax=Streptomyces lunaelactis TaxID=1535768 RepID=UPI0020C7BCD1|nr:hypothetical protein [Streptomyces lunaelactis]